MREISYILETEIKDHHIQFVTINEVRITNDLSYAKVYVTILKDEYKEETLKSLNKAKGFIRKQLAHRVEIRHIPELEFVYDDSIEYSQKIEEELKKINDQKEI